MFGETERERERDFLFEFKKYCLPLDVPYLLQENSQISLVGFVLKAQCHLHAILFRLDTGNFLCNNMSDELCLQ